MMPEPGHLPVPHAPPCVPYLLIPGPPPRSGRDCSPKGATRQCEAPRSTVRPPSFWQPLGGHAGGYWALGFIASVVICSRVLTMIAAASRQRARTLRDPTPCPSVCAPLSRSQRPSTLPLTLPAPGMLIPSPFTLHPSPFTLHPSPFTLHPSPFTLHPSPFTLTLKPTPRHLHRTDPQGGRPQE
jgi:hypothetical protein